MKKTLIVLALASLGVTSAHAAIDSTAVATWQATAKKDTTSWLVVTPLTSLSFQYAEGIEGFNTVNGLFDVAIKGNSGDSSDSYTDFTLKAKKLSGTLNHLSGGSTVEVGIMWQGVPLTKADYTALIDTANGVNGGSLSSLATTFNIEGERSTAQGSFNFFIESATVGNSTSSFSALPDGLWSGEVSVEFVANWA